MAMETAMRFSIITPVYNAEVTLSRCLDSILGQDGGDYELLLINDGSTDGSEAICRKYAEAYRQIRYLRQENGGVSAARNLGLEHAAGEYILFVDSDDYVAEDYLPRIRCALADGPDMLTFGYQNFGGTSSSWDTGDFYESSETGIAQRIHTAMRQYLFSSLWSRVFRRSIIEDAQLRFSSDLSIGEDQLFIFSYAMHIRSLRSITDTLYYVDVSGSGSLSRRARPYLTEQLIAVNRRMYEACRGTPHAPEARRCYEKALSWTVYRSAYSCCKELLKFELSAGQRRTEIRKICKRYRGEEIAPIGWKCRAIALPVRMGWSFAMDLLIRGKARQREQV